tara:strand:- start:91 stop:369 length:279 start_codon:yes stop_codon:yes gene_type:complete
MLIDKKYLSIMTGSSSIEYPPILYVDFYKMKANLKRHWKDNNILHLELGIGSFHLQVEFYWNFTERVRTESEEEFYQDTCKFVASLTDMTED